MIVPIHVSSGAYLFSPAKGSTDLEFCDNCGTVRVIRRERLSCWVCKSPADSSRSDS